MVGIPVIDEYCLPVNKFNQVTYLIFYIMRNVSYLFVVALTAVFTTGCEDSVSDEFEDVNGKVENKLIKEIAITSAQDSEENESISLSYNTNGTLNTITDGSDTSIFVYSGGELETITGSEDNLNIEELYDSPYDAFETGKVLEYDENGNPKKILFYEDEYDDYYEENVINEYTAELSYDDTHNPFYYTLESAGIITVMDNVQLNFSLNPETPSIIQARLLFPVNNLSQIVYKNANGEIMHTINANYVYDEDNYPTSATVTAVSVEHSEQNTISVSFKYVD